MTDGYEPRFDHDRAYGEAAEHYVEEILHELAVGSVEDKRKRRLDIVFYVETEHDPGRRGSYVPSGISTTQADFQAHVIADTGIVVIFPSELLREAVAQDWTTPAEERDGSCPTRGQLVNLGTLLRQRREKP